MNKYNIIYADPPWSYNDKKKSGRTACGAENHYQCMSLENIKSLPVKDLTCDNAVCFIWVVFPMLKEGIEVLESWGFTYKTLGFSWIKTNKNNENIFFGVGAYTKSNCEVCLFGTKGQIGRLLKDDKGNIVVDNKLRVKSNGISSVIIAPKEKHSKKPEIVKTKIVELFGDIPRIELFARQSTPGWNVFGNEVPESISLSAN